MLQKLIERRRQGSEEGFTLIELMVVVLIIAILIAIAIPTFLGARGRSQQRAAQSNVRNAFTAEKTLFTDNDTYSADVTTALPGAEPSLKWVGAEVPGAAGLKNEVSVVVSQTNAAADTVVIGAKSDEGTCYYIRDISSAPSGGTSYAKEKPCTNSNAVPAGDWTTNW